ncbi:MAG: hypothetical protein ACJAXJ_001182 [Colwellia sp.]|jgi:hypothetical protein
MKPNMKVIYDEDCPFHSDITNGENVHLKSTAVLHTISILALVFATTVAAISYYFVANRPPLTLSYPMDAEGRIVKIEPVDQPYPLTSIVKFGVKNTISALHLSFTDYTDRLFEMSSKFSPKGFQEFQENLIKQSWLSKIIDENLTMWAEITKAPKVLGQGTLSSGAHYTDLVFTVKLFLGGGELMFKPTPLKVDVRIVRSDKNLDGLKIYRLLLSEI